MTHSTYDPLDVISMELQKEIDQHVIAHIDAMVKVQNGWIKVTVSTNGTDDFFINSWIYENLSGHWTQHENHWIFELETDATMFALKFG